MLQSDHLRHKNFRPQPRAAALHKNSFAFKLYCSVFVTLASIMTGAQTTKVPHSYSSSTQKFTVAVAKDVVLHDAARKKDLHLSVAYPDSPGKFPVIVFSHGAGGSQDGYQYLTRYWAGYGYIVIQPSHADSIALHHAAGDKDYGLGQAAAAAVNHPDEQQNRPRDISFILDSLPELEKKIPALHDKLDAKHIGVGGHSFGAFTSQALAGATLKTSANTPPMDLSDKRVIAVLAISGQGSGAMSLTEDSWKNLRLPMMFMTGSEDFSLGGHGPEWREEPFLKSPAGDKYLVFINGAAHMTFSGTGAREDLQQGASAIAMDQERTAMLRDVQVSTLAFWDAYLKNDKSALSYLASDELQQMDGRIKFSRR